MEKKLNILFICYIDFGNFSSGSRVRPQKMYQAFLDEGHAVTLLSGRQYWGKNSKREEAVKKIHAYLDSSTPDLCYIEPSIECIYRNYDRNLIKRVHAMGVPIAYFLRDDHEKLGKEFLHRQTSFKKKFRKLVIAHQKKKERKLIRTCIDMVYFPTNEMSYLFNFKRQDALPPGGENILPIFEKPMTKTAICVGGVSEAYGTNILLKAFEILNTNAENEENNYDLILVGRQNELQNIPKKYFEKGWLKIITASGTELTKYYEQASIGVVARPDTAYNNIAFSVKLVEYMSYGLPLVVTENKPMKDFVLNNAIGIVTSFGAENFAQGVKEIFQEKEQFVTYENNVRSSLLEDNLWIHRVRKIIKDLLD